MSRPVPSPFMKRWLLRLLPVWPPFLGAGIRVPVRDLAGGVFETELRLHRWNKNYVGTQYGGSLYSMCDPFYMLILTEQLGPGFVVWDKAATIRFLRPGRGTVRARFEIPRERVEEIRREAESAGKVEPRFVAQVIGEDGLTVAEVEKVLSVRKV